MKIDDLSDRAIERANNKRAADLLRRTLKDPRFKNNRQVQGISAGADLPRWLDAKSASWTIWIGQTIYDRHFDDELLDFVNLMLDAKRLRLSLAK